MSKVTKTTSGPGSQGQAAAPPPPPAKLLEPSRKMELTQVLNRMSSVAAVFQVRTESIPNRRFAAFRDLMDVYISAATTDLNGGHDYLFHGVSMNDDQRAEVEKLVATIFGGGEVAEAPAPAQPPSAKGKG